MAARRPAIRLPIHGQILPGKNACRRVPCYARFRQISIREGASANDQTAVHARAPLAGEVLLRWRNAQRVNMSRHQQQTRALAFC